MVGSAVGNKSASLDSPGVAQPHFELFSFFNPECDAEVCVTSLTCFYVASKVKRQAAESADPVDPFESEPPDN